MPTAGHRIRSANLDGWASEYFYIPADPVGLTSPSIELVLPPCFGAAPALSTWGLAAMLLLVLGAATLAFRRIRAS